MNKKKTNTLVKRIVQNARKAQEKLPSKNAAKSTTKKQSTKVVDTKESHFQLIGTGAAQVDKWETIPSQSGKRSQSTQQ